MDDLEKLDQKEVDALQAIGEKGVETISRHSKEYRIIKDHLDEKVLGSFKALRKKVIAEGTRDYYAGYAAALDDLQQWIEKKSR